MPTKFACYPHSSTQAIQQTQTVKIITFADDTTITGLISGNDESVYRGEVGALVIWCSENNLELNVSKTKEILIDLEK